jgi:hypothetical protein
LTQLHRGKGGKPPKPAIGSFVFPVRLETSRRVDFPNRAQKSDPLSPLRAVSFTHFQLLSKTAAAGQGQGLLSVRAGTGSCPSPLWLDRRRTRPHAGACPSAHQRATSLHTGGRHAGLEAANINKAQERHDNSFLAAALLRLQRIYCGQDNRKAEVHASQSSASRSGG